MCPAHPGMARHIEELSEGLCGVSEEEADSAAEVLMCLRGGVPFTASDASDPEDHAGQRERRLATGVNPRLTDYVNLDGGAAAAHVPRPPVADAHQQHNSRHCIKKAKASHSSEDEQESSSGSELAMWRAASGGARQGQPAGQRQRDKEWAALTTWIRMNLHHPRTAKKVVLFVGSRDPATGAWSFFLNPRLSWADVSDETKQRLKTLPDETACTYARKYPSRPPGDWAHRPQKYRAPGSTVVEEVPLGELVMSLQGIYFQYQEGCAGTAVPAPLLQPEGQHPDAPQRRLETIKQEPRDGGGSKGAGPPAAPPSKRRRVEPAPAGDAGNAAAKLPVPAVDVEEGIGETHAPAEPEPAPARPAVPFVRQPPPPVLAMPLHPPPGCGWPSAARPPSGAQAWPPAMATGIPTGPPFFGFGPLGGMMMPPPPPMGPWMFGCPCCMPGALGVPLQRQPARACGAPQGVAVGAVMPPLCGHKCGARGPLVATGVPVMPPMP